MPPKNNEAQDEDADVVKTETAVETASVEIDTTTDANGTTATDTAVSTPSVSFDDKTESNEQEEEDKPVKFGKIVDPHVLGCCEFCGGPVKRRRFCSPLKRFCSKGCSRSSRKAKVQYAKQGKQETFGMYFIQGKLCYSKTCI